MRRNQRTKKFLSLVEVTHSKSKRTKPKALSSRDLRNITNEEADLQDVPKSTEMTR